MFKARETWKVLDSQSPMKLSEQQQSLGEHTIATVMSRESCRLCRELPGSSTVSHLSWAGHLRDAAVWSFR